MQILAKQILAKQKRPWRTDVGLVAISLVTPNTDRVRYVPTALSS
jgi:hypothetical protein